MFIVKISYFLFFWISHQYFSLSLAYKNILFYEGIVNIYLFIFFSGGGGGDFVDKDIVKRNHMV